MNPARRAHRNPGLAASEMMDELKTRAENARNRLLGEYTDPDEIVRLLGGSFTERDEYRLQGGHTVTVIVGRNRREATIIGTNGKVSAPVRIYEPVLRKVK